jgi:hypothetical protein
MTDPLDPTGCDNPYCHNPKCTCDPCDCKKDAECACCGKKQ